MQRKPMPKSKQIPKMKEALKKLGVDIDNIDMDIEAMVNSGKSYGDNFEKVKQYVQNKPDETLDGAMQDDKREEELKNFREELRAEFNSDTGYDLSSEDFEELLERCEVLFSPPVHAISLSGSLAPPKTINQEKGEIMDLYQNIEQIADLLKWKKV